MVDFDKLIIDLGRLQNSINRAETEVEKVGAFRLTIELLRETAHQLKKLEAIQVNDILA